jgi:DNA-binding response OmpR family regulator
VKGTGAVMVDGIGPYLGGDTRAQISRTLREPQFLAIGREDASPGNSSDGESAKTIRFGHLEMMEDQYCVKTRRGSISLTAAEYRVLWKLARNIGSVVGYSDLDRPDLSDRRINHRAVQAIVASLRRKLSPHGCEIRTTRDLGYLLTR